MLAKLKTNTPKKNAFRVIELPSVCGFRLVAEKRACSLPGYRTGASLSAQY
jgi:hypothetical protein